MPEHEAALLVIEMLALSDQYAESLWRNVDVWVGISVGLVILSHVAPKQLTQPTTTILVALYSAYTYMLVEKTLQLVGSMNLTRVDALRIAEENGIQFRAFEAVSRQPQLDIIP